MKSLEPFQGCRPVNIYAFTFMHLTEGYLWEVKNGRLPIITMNEVDSLLYLQFYRVGVGVLCKKGEGGGGG